MKKTGFLTSAKFALQLPKANGFNLETAFAELVDNSIDAGSKKVTLKKVKQDEKPVKGEGDYYTFSFKDNGCGMSKEELEEKIPTLGYEGKYENDSVGYYGIGGRFAMLYLCDQGVITIISIKDNKKTKVLITPKYGINKDELICFYESEKTQEPNGTEISITNVKDTNNNTSTIKFLCATYYPQSVTDKDFVFEYINQNGETTLIEFCDPLYRKKSEKYVRKIEFDEDDETFKPWVNGHFIKTTGYLYNSDVWTDNDFNYFDLRSKDKGFNITRAGLYLRMGGRYISLGNGYFPGYAPQYYLNRLRIEVNIPKECIDIFGIELNKSKVKIDHENPALQNWYKVIKYLVTEATRDKKDARVSEKEEDELTLINKIINDQIKNRGKLRNPLEDEKLKNLIPKENNFPDKPEPISTKNRPHGLTYDKNQFELKYIDGKEHEPRYTGSRSGTKTVISLNAGHPHYEKVYKKLDLTGKRTLVMEFYCEYITFLQTQVSYDNLDENFFYEVIQKKDEIFRRIYIN